MSKPRVLILENSVAITGALKSVLRSSLYLREWYDIVFVLPSGSEGIGLIVQQGFECEELPMREIRKNVLSLISYFPILLLNSFRFARLIKQQKIDLVVNNDFYNLIPPCYSFFGGKIKYVCYVRFLPAKFPKTLVKLWHGLHRKFASQIIAVSEVVRKELPDQNKVVVVGNELPQMEEVLFVPSTSKIILYPANYINGKGHQYAIESFSGLVKKYPDWKLRFVGGDMGLAKNKRYKESLIQIANGLGMSDRVEWMGFVSDMDLEYLKASIILNFSESESFSLTCLEGLFYGRTVVATDCGGPSEIIDHDVTGIIVPIGDIAKMQEVMDSLMGDRSKREALAEKGYLSIREKFSNSKITSLLHKIYDAALMNK